MNRILLVTAAAIVMSGTALASEAESDDTQTIIVTGKAAGYKADN